MFIPTRPNRPSIAKKIELLARHDESRHHADKIIGTINRITIGFLYARNSSSSVMKIQDERKRHIGRERRIRFLLRLLLAEDLHTVPLRQADLFPNLFNTSVKAALVLVPLRTGSHWAIITRSRL